MSEEKGIPPRIRYWLLPASLWASLTIPIPPALAEQGSSCAGAEAGATALPPTLPRNSLAIFAGVYTTSFWARSFNASEVGYEPNFVIAIITAKDLLVTSSGLRIGHESGMALRFGREISFEMWRGVTVSVGARLLGGITITPRLVVGLSTISNAIGVEVEREIEEPHGDVVRLVYLGSELARSLETLTDVEVFYRLHHRSGAAHFWGNVAAGHNANGVGIRVRY